MDMLGKGHTTTLPFCHELKSFQQNYGALGGIVVNWDSKNVPLCPCKIKCEIAYLSFSVRYVNHIPSSSFCENLSWPFIQPQKLKAVLLCHTCTASSRRNEFRQLKSLQRNTVEVSLLCKTVAQVQWCSFMVVQLRSAGDIWVPLRFILVLCRKHWSFLAESGYRTLQFFTAHS